MELHQSKFPIILKHILIDSKQPVFHIVQGKDVQKTTRCVPMRGCSFHIQYMVGL